MCILAVLYLSQVSRLCTPEDPTCHCSDGANQRNRGSEGTVSASWTAGDVTGVGGASEQVHCVGSGSKGRW